MDEKLILTDVGRIKRVECNICRNLIYPIIMTVHGERGTVYLEDVFTMFSREGLFVTAQLMENTKGWTHVFDIRLWATIRKIYEMQQLYGGEFDFKVGRDLELVTREEAWNWIAHSAKFNANDIKQLQRLAKGETEWQCVENGTIIEDEPDDFRATVAQILLLVKARESGYDEANAALKGILFNNTRKNWRN